MQRELTPFICTSPLLPSQTTPGLCFKAENLQKTGSFKVRPAFAQLLRLSPDEQNRGLVTSSSGNFAQAAAFSAKALGLDLKVVMMKGASPLKREKTLLFGGKVVPCEDRFEARQETVDSIVRTEGRSQIFPYDHPLAILGNATAGMEILQQAPAAANIVVPVSGGGLISGILTAVRASGRQVNVWGVQPSGSNATALSFQEKKPVAIEAARTIADGLSVTRPGHHTFPIIRDLAHDLVVVEEDSIRRAVRRLFSEEKLVVEPSGAVTLAAVLEKKVPADSVCLLSGGNVSPKLFAELIQAG